MEKAGPQRGYQAAGVRMEDRWLGILKPLLQDIKGQLRDARRPYWRRTSEAYRQQRWVVEGGRKAPSAPPGLLPATTLGSLLHLRAARVQSCHRGSVRIPVSRAREDVQARKAAEHIRLLHLFHFLLALQRTFPVDATTTPRPRVAMATPVRGALWGLPVIPLSVRCRSRRPQRPG